MKPPRPVDVAAVLLVNVVCMGRFNFVALGRSINGDNVVSFRFNANV